MSGMTHCDVVALNGRNRIMTNGAPQARVMPNGCMGNPVFFSLPILTGASSWMPLTIWQKFWAHTSIAA
jgi:hypothetical protein